MIEMESNAPEHHQYRRNEKHSTDLIRERNPSDTGEHTASYV